MTRHFPTGSTPAAIAVLLAALLSVLAVRHILERPPEPPPPPQPLRAAWLPGAEAEPGAGSDYPFGLALASDGRRVVFPAAKAGAVTLWLQDLRTGDTRALPGADRAVAPFWSPDGSRIGFFSGGQLRVLDLNAGTVAPLADAASPRGAAWNAAGDIVFAPAANGGLLIRKSLDGSIAPLTMLDAKSGESAHTWPSFLDDGRHVVFLVTATDRVRAGIWMASLDQPESRKRLIATDTQAIVAGNTLLILNDQTLLAHAYDPAAQQLAARGTPVGLVVGRGPLGQTFATASHDLLIYGAPGTALRELRWVSRDGATSGRVGEPVDAWDLRVAPDGRRVAVTEVDPQLRTLDVFIREGSQPVATRLSRSTDLDESGVWSPDGLRIAWAARRRDVMIRGAGAVLPEQTIASFDAPVQVWDWSRDGRSLLIGLTHPDTRDDLWIQPPTEGAAARPYETRAFNQTFGAISPDGRWVAYASDESGKFDVYIDSFPTPGIRTRITTAGGTEPRWSRDGELFFRRGSDIHHVELGPGHLFQHRAAPLAVTAMNRLFDAGAAVRSYDVSPDGRRFLINLPASGATRAPITLVHHWSAFFETLRRDKP